MDELEKIYEEIEKRGYITTEDRLHYTKYTFKSLIDYLEYNYSISQIDEINRLVINNLFDLNVAIFYVLDFNNPEDVFIEKRWKEVIDEISNEGKKNLESDIYKDTNIIFQWVKNSIAIKYILSNRDSGLEIKFKGKIPKSGFLGTRQMHADSWIKSYCEFILSLSKDIFYWSDQNKDYCRTFLISNTVFFLVKEMPRIFSKFEHENTQDFISRIYKQFIDIGTAYYRKDPLYDLRKIANKIQII